MTVSWLLMLFEDDDTNFLVPFKIEQVEVLWCKIHNLLNSFKTQLL
jgi:hypothetical protein